VKARLLTAFGRKPRPARAAEPLATSAGAGPVSAAARIDELALTIHAVMVARTTVSLLTAFMALFILPRAACAVWAAGAMALEIWCWFATRPQVQDRPARPRDRASFVLCYAGITLWWLVLGGLFWSSGSTAGHAMAAALFVSIAMLAILLCHSTPTVFLAAGMAPATAALTVVNLAGGLDARHMLPVWLVLGLGAIFNLGRALETPSAQESQRRINASLRDFEIIAENVTDIITRTDVDGIREYVSPGCLAVLGYRPDELVGTSHGEQLHPDDQPVIVASRRRMVADPSRAESMTVRVRHKDGRWLWLQSSAKMILEGGLPVGLIGVSRDVTEQVEIDKALYEAKLAAEQANRAKAEFLANVSHEIRTPMNGILSALHLLEREPISEEGRELMRHADDSGRMLSQLLNDVLDFSKIEAGQLDLSPEPMNVAEALEGVIALLAGQARAKGVVLTREIIGGELWIEADPVRVRQAIFNLVGNAMKFTAQGRVCVRLALGPAGDGRRYVRLEVEDTGIGMNAKAQRHLFERFRQAEGDAVRRFGGTGLGLSITQALVRMMGGEISFVSAEGEGSTFQMVFDAPAAAALIVQPVEEGLLEGVSILLVEDNPTNRLMARTMLSRLGADVEDAEDGLLGLEAARRGAHDLILMDVQMPRMDGVEATRAIRGLASAVARTPIIGLTANVMVHQRVEYLAAGMNGVIAKPISPAALLAEIARVISEVDEVEVEAEAEAGAAEAG
jgi:PAS domain S-box-containing protein